MRTFQKYDYPTICDWMMKRKQDALDYSSLPPTGLIVDSAACGFLIHCDNGWGVLDFFITNPEMPKDIRKDALHEIASSLIHLAKVAGIKTLKCDTDINSIYQLAVHHGFVAVGSYKSMVRRF